MIAGATLGVKIAFGVFTSLAGMILSKHLRKKKGPVLTEGSKPQTLVSRGDTLPLLIGRTRGGPAFMWEGARSSLIEPSSNAGGKGVGGGGTGTDNRVYFAKGIHALAVGPGQGFYEIRQNGKVIWPIAGQYPNGISPGTHPSGSVLECTSDPEYEGQFAIYWGETDQPIGVLSSDPTLMDSGSAWPFVMRVDWLNKRLGGADVWPAMEYEYEVRPYNSGRTHNNGAPASYDSLVPHLGAGTEPWLRNGKFIDTPNAQPIILTDAGGLGTYATLKLCNDQTAIFMEGESVEILNNSTNSDGRYVLEDVTYNATEVINQPVGPFQDRAVAPNYGAWGNLDPNIGILSIVTSGQFPPGVVLDGTHAFSSTITSNTTGVEKYSRVDPTAGGLIPSGGVNEFDWGLGTNTATFYVRRGQVVGQFANIRVGFADAPNGGNFFGANIQVASTGLTVMGLVGGATAFVGQVSTDWWVVSLSAPFFTITPSVLGTDSLFYSIGFAASSPANRPVTICLSDGTSGPFKFSQFQATANCTGVTTLELNQVVSSLVDGAGAVYPLVVDPVNGNQGANGAALLYQLLFETFPHGVGLDIAEFNVTDLQNVSALLGSAGEGLRCHAFIQQGTTFEDTIQAIMEDLGISIGWDAATAQFRFDLVRQTTVADVTLNSDMVVSRHPEIVRQDASAMPDRVGFRFLARNLNYREEMVVVDDSGRALRETRSIRRTNDIMLARDLETARAIAARRALPEMFPESVFKTTLNRDAPMLRPFLTVDSGGIFGTDVMLRILSIARNSQAGTLEVTMATDAFATQRGDAYPEVVLGSPSVEVEAPSATVPQDVAQRVWEVPAVLADGRISLAFLRLADSDQCSRALVSVSSSGTSYQALGQTATSMGGRVLSVLDKDYRETLGGSYGADVIEEGIAFQAHGQFDIDSVLADEHWHEGRYLMVARDEVMFVREFEALGNDSFRAKGVIRARYGTKRQTHSPNEYVYVIRGEAAIASFKDSLAGRGQDFYAKMQVVCDGIIQSAALAPALNPTIQGTAVRPLPMANLNRPDTLVRAYQSGTDLPLRWDYRSPSGWKDRTGAGMQRAGEVAGSGQPMQGTYTVVIGNPAATIIYRTVTGLTDPAYTYTSTDRAADFAANSLADPQDLRIQVVAIGTNAEASDRLIETFSGI